MRARILSSLLLSFACGCANYATLQDPETVPKNRFQLGVGTTFTQYSIEVEATDTNGATTTVSESFSVPALTLSGRYGATEELEIHGMAWLPFGATIGGKYMLVGDRENGGFAFSPGLDVGYLSVSVGDESATLVDVYVPMHMGYRTNPSFAVYWTPKYILRLLGGHVGHVGGATLGTAIGKDAQLLLEGSVLYDTTVEDTIIQAGVGGAFM